MKLFFVFFCILFFYISNSVAMDFSTQINSKKTEVESNNIPSRDNSTKPPFDKKDKSTRVITVRIYTEEDCD
ncbi:MAG: hypothetical protein QM504_01795 [Pseudomonadota bacterium]